MNKIEIFLTIGNISFLRLDHTFFKLPITVAERVVSIRVLINNQIQAHVSKGMKQIVITETVILNVLLFPLCLCIWWLLMPTYLSIFNRQAESYELQLFIASGVLRFTLFCFFSARMMYILREETICFSAVKEHICFKCQTEHVATWSSSFLTRQKDCTKYYSFISLSSNI